MRRHRIVRWLSAILLPIALGTAIDSVPASAEDRRRGCVDRYDAKADYFPDKATVEDAVGFGVTYHRSYKVVVVKQPVSGGRPERYVLVQCGTPSPRLVGELAGAQVVRVPVTSLCAASSTHVPLLAELQRFDVLTGVARSQDVAHAEVRARLAAGLTRQFAADSVLDVEAIVRIHPDLLMVSGLGSAGLTTIAGAGIPVVTDAEWLEPTALGRAEWLKYMALFLNEERRAEAVYAATKARYRALSSLAASIPAGSRPLVMTGRSSRGVFVVAGGRSYVSSLIADAGGRYVWADNGSVGIASIDMETQIHRSAEADIWINGRGWRSLAAMREDEPRYVNFKAFRSGQVWVYDGRLASGRPSDYWSRSVTRPDLVLADLIKIFHPSLVPSHAFEWYTRVPAR